MLSRLFDQATDRIWDNINRGVSFCPWDGEREGGEVDGWLGVWGLIGFMGSRGNGRIFGPSTLRSSRFGLLLGDKGRREGCGESWGGIPW